MFPSRWNFVSYLLISRRSRIRQAKGLPHVASGLLKSDLPEFGSAFLRRCPDKRRSKEGTKLKTSRPPVVILNMAHTGLGIARNLRSQQVPVFAATGKRELVGNYTRYAKLLVSPDSAEAPEELASFLGNLAKRLAARCVLFPTRDQDVLFIERFREALAEHYLMALPAPGVLTRLLDKVEMAEAASKVGVPLPRTRLVKNRCELRQV